MLGQKQFEQRFIKRDRMEGGKLVVHDDDLLGRLEIRSDLKPNMHCLYPWLKGKLCARSGAPDRRKPLWRRQIIAPTFFKFLSFPATIARAPAHQDRQWVINSRPHQVNRSCPVRPGKRVAPVKRKNPRC